MMSITTSTHEARLASAHRGGSWQRV